MSGIEWTGERFVPWLTEAEVAYEHLHRYAYASRLAAGRTVLDLGCGEGYGSAMLAGGATKVVGVDIDAEVIRHARGKYSAANLEFHCGSITAIPAEVAGPFDLIVCFEALEHIREQDALLSEVRRLLRSGGTFIVSTPNKPEYDSVSGHGNHFHVKELDFPEFSALLSRHFPHTRFLAQRVTGVSRLWPLGASTGAGPADVSVEKEPGGFRLGDQDGLTPMYFIAVVSDLPIALDTPPSTLFDKSDALLKERRSEIAELERMRQAASETVESQRVALEWRAGQLRSLAESLETERRGNAWLLESKTELERGIASRDETIQWLEQQQKESAEAIRNRDTALAWRAGQVAELETVRAGLERALAGAQTQVQQLGESLAAIHHSRGWKFVQWVRKWRSRLGA